MNRNTRKRYIRYDGVITILTPVDTCSTVSSEKDRLRQSLRYSSEVIESFACNMYEGGPANWKQHLLGHSFSAQDTKALEGSLSFRHYLTNVVTWLKENEEAQVLLASVLVVVGVWWLVRTLISVIINLVFPMIMVSLAIVMVPQLRQPLLGQNYMFVSNLVRNVLLKIADCLSPE